MGWTCTHYPTGKRFLDFCKEEFEYENKNGSLKVLDACLKNFREGYMAVEKTVAKTGERFVFAVAMMVSWHKDDYHNICYKEMDETEHPFLCNCPERILKLLTPTDNEDAKAWREKCRETIRLNKRINTIFKKIKEGDKLVFENHLHFTDGHKTKEMIVTRKTKKKLYADTFYVITKKSLINNSLDKVISKDGEVITLN